MYPERAFSALFVFASEAADRTYRDARGSANQTQCEFRGRKRHVTLHWNAEPGQIYHVAATDDLEHPDWNNISGWIFAMDQAETWSDWNPSATQRFYRIAKD